MTSFRRRILREVFALIGGPLAPGGPAAAPRYASRLPTGTSPAKSRRFRWSLSVKLRAKSGNRSSSSATRRNRESPPLITVFKQLPKPAARAGNPRIFVPFLDRRVAFERWREEPPDDEAHPLLFSRIDSAVRQTDVFADEAARDQVVALMSRLVRVSGLRRFFGATPDGEAPHQP